VPPAAQAKLKEKFPHFSVDWKEIFSLPLQLRVTLKLENSNKKNILNNIVFTNQ